MEDKNAFYEASNALNAILKKQSMLEIMCSNDKKLHKQVIELIKKMAENDEGITTDHPIDF